MTGQQITTAAELDALPVGSVGSGAEGQTYARYAGGWFGAGRLHPLDTSTEVSFPVVVLYRPDSPVVQPAGDGATDEREACAEVIWNASRDDEGTISGIGAKHVADAVLAAGFCRQVTPADDRLGDVASAEQVQAFVDRVRVATGEDSEVDHDLEHDLLIESLAVIDRLRLAQAAHRQPAPTVTAEQVEAARRIIERYERAAGAAQKSGEVEYPVVVGGFARQLRDALGLVGAAVTGEQITTAAEREESL